MRRRRTHERQEPEAPVTALVPIPPSPVRSVGATDAEVQRAENAVELTKHQLTRRELERRLLREELELEADRIKGNVALAQERVAADKTLGDLEAARLNPELAAGDTVRARRNELGLSQPMLADRSGVPVRRISEIEAGKGGLDYHLRRVAVALDLDYRPAQFSRPDREPFALVSGTEESA